MTDQQQEEAKKSVLKLTEDNLIYISNAITGLKDIISSDNDSHIKKTCILVAILRKFIDEQLANQTIEIINNYQRG